MRNETLQAERMSDEAKLRGKAQHVPLSVVRRAHGPYEERGSSRADNQHEPDPDRAQPHRALHPLLRRHPRPRVDHLALVRSVARLCASQVRRLSGRLGGRERRIVSLVWRGRVCGVRCESAGSGRAQERVGNAHPRKTKKPMTARMRATPSGMLRGTTKISVSSTAETTRGHSLVVPVPGVPAVEERADSERRDHCADAKARVEERHQDAVFFVCDDCRDHGVCMQRGAQRERRNKRTRDRRAPYIPDPNPMKPSMMIKAGKGGAMERMTQPVDMAAAAVRSETWRPK